MVTGSEHKAQVEANSAMQAREAEPAFMVLRGAVSVSIATMSFIKRQAWRHTCSADERPPRCPADGVRCAAAALALSPQHVLGENGTSPAGAEF